MNKYKYNYHKLKTKIKELYRTQYNFANAINLSPSSISKKLNNINYFTQQEIKTIIELLQITPEEINLYFFNTEVE